MGRRFVTIYFNLIHSVPPKVVGFDFGDDPVNFEDSVSVNCLISSGDMPVEIIWLLNNNAMDSYYGSGVNIMKSGKRASVLTIDAVHAGHVGNYTCLAKNRAGQASHSAKLIVNGSYSSFQLHIFVVVVCCFFFFVCFCIYSFLLKFPHK